MYQYRQIIFRLRQGDSIRGIAQAKLAGFEVQMAGNVR